MTKKFNKIKDVKTGKIKTF